MNRRTMERIDAALDGRLAAGEFAALQQELREDPAAFDHWCRQAEIHGRLEWELAGEMPAVRPLPKKTAAHSHLRFRFRFLPYAAAAVALLACGLTLGWWLGSHRTTPGSTAERSLSAPGEDRMRGAVARITAGEDAEWVRHSPRIGEWVGTGSLELAAGSAVVTFDCGATVQLRGPARLHLASPTRALLESGTATVDIPRQAYGFVFETPATEISRRMSRFAVAVEAEGQAEIHVLEGQIQLAGKLGDLDTLDLAKDGAVRIGGDGSVIPGTRYAPGQLAPTALPESGDLLPQWFVHWSFDGSDMQTGTFRETGRHEMLGGGATFTAQVHLAQPEALVALTPGRFGSAVRMNGQRGFLATRFRGIAGDHARTVAFWVRIPPGTSETLAYSFLSWGTKDTAGGGKWQLGWNTGSDNAGVVGAIRTEVEGGYLVGSTDLRTGRWHHVVSVFTGGEGANVASHVRHYIDGRLEAVTAVKAHGVNTLLDDPKALPVTLGRRLDVDSHYRTFSGELDEVYLFPSALTPEQIERLYRENLPPALKP